MAITSSYKSQFRQCELPAPNTNHMFLENKPFSYSHSQSYLQILIGDLMIENCYCRSDLPVATSCREAKFAPTEDAQ